MHYFFNIYLDERFTIRLLFYLAIDLVLTCRLSNVFSVSNFSLVRTTILEGIYLKLQAFTTWYEGLPKSKTKKWNRTSFLVWNKYQSDSITFFGLSQKTPWTGASTEQIVVGVRRTRSGYSQLQRLTHHRRDRLLFYKMSLWSTKKIKLNKIG